MASHLVGSNASYSPAGACRCVNRPCGSPTAPNDIGAQLTCIMYGVGMENGLSGPAGSGHATAAKATDHRRLNNMIGYARRKVAQFKKWRDHQDIKHNAFRTPEPDELLEEYAIRKMKQFKDWRKETDKNLKQSAKEVMSKTKDELYKHAHKPAKVVTSSYGTRSLMDKINGVKPWGEGENLYDVLNSVGESNDIMGTIYNYDVINGQTIDIKDTLANINKNGDAGELDEIEVVKPDPVELPSVRPVITKAVQSEGSAQVDTKIDLPDFDKQVERIPQRHYAKVLSKPKTRLVYSQLLNFLRIKHFMHYRDHHFITTLVADARAWLLAKKLPVETPIEYSMLAMAVTQAFLVSQEELEFRARIKNQGALDHIRHLNATMQGNLGRTFRGKGLISEAKHQLKSPFMRNEYLVPQSIPPV